MANRGFRSLRRYLRTVSVAFAASFLLGMGFAGWHVAVGVVPAVEAVDDGAARGRPPIGHDEQTCQACSMGISLPRPAAAIGVSEPAPVRQPADVRSPSSLLDAFLASHGARAPPFLAHRIG